MATSSSLLKRGSDFLAEQAHPNPNPNPNPNLTLTRTRTRTLTPTLTLTLTLGALTLRRGASLPLTPPPTPNLYRRLRSSSAEDRPLARPRV